MRTFIAVTLALALIAVTWYTLGWIALLVVPAMALFGLMTFAPLHDEWPQHGGTSSTTPC